LATTITLDQRDGEVLVLGPDGRRIGGQVQAATIPPAKRGDLLREIGSGGPAILAGLIVDDEEHNQKLRGVDGVRIFDRMRRTDAQVAGVLAGLQLPILSAEPVIDRPEGQEAEKITDEHLDFARYNCFERINFSEVLQHILSCFWAGYSWFEKVYAVEDGALVLERLAPRLAVTLWRWEADDRGNITGVTQRSRVGAGSGGLYEIQIPRNKLAIFTSGKEAGDPGGRSLLRAAYRAYTIKDALYKLEGIRFERFAIGVPVIKLPEQYTSDQMDMAREITKYWRGAEQSHVVLVGDMSVDLMQVKGGEALDIQPAIRHHNEEIAKSLLMQFINLGTSDSGSRALGESMMGFFYDAIEGHAKSLADQFNREVLWPTLDLNFPDQPRPTLRFEDIGAVSLAQLADGLQKLQLLISPDLETENFVRRKFGLPVRLEVGTPPVPVEEHPEEQEEVSGSGHKHIKLGPDGLSFWRELTEPETFVHLRSIDARLDEVRDALVEVLMDFRAQIGKQIKAQIKARWSEGPSGLAKVEVGEEAVADAAKALEPELTAVFDFGRAEVAGELKRQAKAKGVDLKRKRGNVRTATILHDQAVRVGGGHGLKASLAASLQLRDEGLTPAEIEELTRFRAGMMATRLSDKTQAAAIAMAGDRWRTQGGDEPTGDALDAIMEEVFSFAEREATLIANLNASEALNLGRDFELRRHEDQIETMIFSAILDEGTCEQCSAADGEETEYGSEEYYDLSPPLNSRTWGACAGGTRCRCLQIAVLRADFQ